MFGYRSQDDVIYHPIEYFAFGDESILEEIHRINCAARENGEWQGDLILKGRDGTTTCYDLTVRTISDYSDKILYAVLSFVDRTHIKSLVPGPGATDGEIGGIIEFLPDPTFVIDCDRRVTAWNRAMEEFSGIMRCNMIGTGDYPGISSLSGGAGPVLIDMLDMPEEEIRATYPDVIKLGSALIAGIRGTDSGAQGKTACLARASPIPDSGGTRRGAIMTIRDIGSLKMFGESLTRAHDRSRADIQDKLDKLSVEHRNLEQEYNHLIATHNEEAPLADAMNRTADLVVILDRTGKIINSNRATESTINGSSGGTVRGKHISLLIAPEYRKVVLDSLDEAQKNGHTKVRYFLVTCEGRVMVETTLSVLKEDADETSGYILIQRVQNTADRNVRLR